MMNNCGYFLGLNNDQKNFNNDPAIIGAFIFPSTNGVHTR